MNTQYYSLNRIFGFAVLLICFSSNVLAEDVVYFNTKEIIHIQDSCTSDDMAQCTEVPYYTHIHIATGKTYKDVAIRTPVPETSGYYSYSYMDDKGQTHEFDELSSEPLYLHSFSRSLFGASDHNSYQASNETQLSFKVKKGFNGQDIIWFYRYNSRPNGCGDVISLSLETGEILGDAIIFTQICTFPDMKLQQSYATYRKMIQSDNADGLHYTKLRATFPKEKNLEDEFTDPEWLAMIKYSRLTPDKGRIEILRECGDSDIMIE